MSVLVAVCYESVLKYKNALNHMWAIGYMAHNLNTLNIDNKDESPVELKAAFDVYLHR